MYINEVAERSNVSLSVMRDKVRLFSMLARISSRDANKVIIALPIVCSSLFKIVHTDTVYLTYTTSEGVYTWSCKVENVGGRSQAYIVSLSSNENVTLIDRRHDRRHAVLMRVFYTTSDNEKRLADVVDVSMKGLGFKCDNNFSIGDEIIFEVISDGLWLSVPIVVVRKQALSEGEYRYGATFSCDGVSKVKQFLNFAEKESLSCSSN